ncbi:3561_t:CDS:1, partial [Scutellospora calospora]
NKIKKKPKHESKNTIEYLVASTTQNLNSIQYFNIETSIQNRIIEKVIIPSILLPNIIAQNKAKEVIIKTNNKITKYQEDYNSTTNLKVKYKLINHIQNLKQ